jgi:excisionase family DNA binding protein
MEEKFLTVREAARRLNLTEKTVISRIKDGNIKAKKVGKSWRIEANSLPFQENPPTGYLQSTIEMLKHELEVRDKQIEVKDRQIEELNTQIRELHALLGMKALPEGKKPWWRFWRR